MGPSLRWGDGNGDRSMIGYIIIAIVIVLVLGLALKLIGLAIGVAIVIGVVMLGVKMVGNKRLK